MDITLEAGNGLFSHRVGAIIIDSGCVLLAKNNDSNRYYSVGGRVMFGESTADAVLRESLEEIKIGLEIERLAFIHENIFFWEAMQRPLHEIAFFYLMKPERSLRETVLEPVSETYGEVSFHWIELDSLSDVDVFPEFFKTELKNMPETVCHIITKDDLSISRNA